jgi:hypothetical protein
MSLAFIFAHSTSGIFILTSPVILARRLMTLYCTRMPRQIQVGSDACRRRGILHERGCEVQPAIVTARQTSSMWTISVSFSDPPSIARDLVGGSRRPVLANSRSADEHHYDRRERSV